MKVSINGGTPNPLVNGYFLYQHFSPQLCVGFLFLILYPGSPPPRLLHTQLCHTPSFTYNFVNHHLSHPIFHTQLCQPPSVTHHLSHTTLSTTIFHTQLCHTPSFTHTTLSTTIFHTQLCHTPSFTYNFVNHHLSHTQLCHTHHLSHTTLSTTILATSTFVWCGRQGTWSHPPSFCVAGVALMALGGVLGSVLVAGDAAALCVAGVALGHIHLRFTWQAWHLWYWVARLGRF